MHTNQLIQADLGIEPGLEADEKKEGAHLIALKNHITAKQENLKWNLLLR